jgi:hypothetical protein
MSFDLEGFINRLAAHGDPGIEDELNEFLENVIHEDPESVVSKFLSVIVRSDTGVIWISVLHRIIECFLREN